MIENTLNIEQLENSLFRRRDLLPKWIKVFIWFFLIFGVLAPFAFTLGLVGASFSASIYGLKANQALSFTGIFITLLYLLKGIVAFGLWTEKKWAVNLAITDALIGIILCSVMMYLSFVNPINGLVLGFELILLIPYLVKMIKIKNEWIVINNPNKPARPSKVMTLVGVIVFILVFGTLSVGSLMINSDAYKIAVQEIEKNQDIIDKTGGISGYGMMPMGNIEIANGYGKADLKIKVRGNEKNIKVDVRLAKLPKDEWKLIGMYK